MSSSYPQLALILAKYFSIILLLKVKRNSFSQIKRHTNEKKQKTHNSFPNVLLKHPQTLINKDLFFSHLKPGLPEQHRCPQKSLGNDLGACLMSLPNHFAKCHCFRACISILSFSYVHLPSEVGVPQCIYKKNKTSPA